MEAEFIEWLRAQIPAHRYLDVGIGDDAAVLASHLQATVISTDLLTEGVDFRLAADEPRRIGRKALAVNLSDLAAMAARPLAAVVAVALPRDAALDLAKAIYAGLLPLAERFDLVLAGGDTNTWDGPLVIAVTVLGQPTGRGPLLRSGAKVGDVILVTGSLGGSILGKQFDFEPRVADAIELHKGYELHAAIDVSDGLSLDLSRLAAASQVGVVVDPAAVPIAPAAHDLSKQRADGVTPLEHALSDGEDFELIVALSADEAQRLLREQPLPVALTPIGRCIAEPGLWTIDATGSRTPLTPRGYQH